ncbi:MAG: type IX secretion system membrane protein PorP/SprF [Mariniphaga sp.]|nr:type IX secretion system membrane protein PorP/SprF [Mariniphaga sp.]
MKAVLTKGIKIGWLLLMIHFMAGAQTGQGLIPYSNKLLLNPSYAGFEKQNHFRSSLQLQTMPDKKLNYSWTGTYDTHFNIMEGGYSVQFYQGLDGRMNHSTVGIGAAFSKPFDMSKKGQLISSLGMNLYTKTKKWLVYSKEQNTIVQPSAGLLWNSYSAEVGLAGYFAFAQNQAEYAQNKTPVLLVFHAAKKNEGFLKGLISRPIKINPDLTVVYSPNLFLSRIGFRTRQTSHFWGIYAENNFTDDCLGLSGITGWTIQNFRINLAAGVAYFATEKKLSFLGEAHLTLTLPYIDFDKTRPWLKS